MTTYGVARKMNIKQIILSCKHLFKNIEIIGLRPRPFYEGEKDRFFYQSKKYDFQVKPKDKVLDVGCGAYPVPFATILVDLYIEKSEHRAEEIKTNGKPLVIADIERLPFEDKTYDFVFCSHLMEHTTDPIIACEELMRVGKRGYIETPSLMTDALFSWAKGMHKWFTVIMDNRIVFFEYDDRLAEGVHTSYWRDSIFSKRYHPLQTVFFQNLDLFNNSMIWEDRFNYSVFYLNGEMRHSGY